MRLNRFMIRPLVEAGLREELNAGDTTGGFLIWDEDPIQTGQIYAKGHGVACGLLFADETIMLIDPQAQVEHCVEEGALIAPGTVLLKIRAREIDVASRLLARASPPRRAATWTWSSIPMCA